MTDSQFKFLKDRLATIEFEISLIKQASTLRAKSEQSVVGQPNVVESENPALSRPATLTELKTLLQEKRIATRDFMGHGPRRAGWLECYETVLQWIDDLDQGPIAKSPSKLEATFKEWSDAGHPIFPQ